MAEDVMRGRREIPKTLNRYGYCLSNPVNLIDFDGNIPAVAVPAMLFFGVLLSGCGARKEEISLEETQIENNIPIPSEPVVEYKFEESSAMSEAKIITDIEEYDISARNELIEFQILLEGFEPTKYKATKNEVHYTIGYGHLCDDIEGEDKKYLEEGYVMSQNEALELLIKDLETHTPKEEINRIIKSGVKLYDYQADALVSMSFNGVDISSDKSPNFNYYLSSGQYSEAETLYHLMSYTTQKKLNSEEREVLTALVKRRIAEARLFSGLGYPVVASGDFYSDKDYLALLYEYAKSFDLREYNSRICDTFE